LGDVVITALTCNGERDPVASGTEEGYDEEDETGAHAEERDEG